MKYCEKCGSIIKDDDRFCQNCGARIDDPQQNSSPSDQNTASQNYSQTYASPSSGPKKDNTKGIIIAIVAVAVVLILVVAFTLPNFVTVEEVADYRVDMKISNVSIEDTANGFEHAEKDALGRLHTYLVYKCNNSAETYHELGWCRTDGIRMIIDEDKRTASFDVVSEQSKIKMSIFLVVVTKTAADGNHYDYVDLYDVTKTIQGDKPSGENINYGTSGVSFTLSELDNYQTVLKGDSQPVGSVTLTFVITKK